MYDSPILGKYMLAIANSHRLDLNQTKLHKIMYIIYGYFLTKNIEITSENPQAWPYGPVFPKARNTINFSKEYNLSDSMLKDIANSDYSSEIEDIVKKFGRFSAQQLVDWSHTPNGPWHETIHKKDFKWSHQIDKGIIKNYFEDLTMLDSMAKNDLEFFLERLSLDSQNSNPDYDSFDLETQVDLAKLKRLIDDNKGRTGYAKWVAWIVSVWLFSVLLILILNSKVLLLSDAVLIALLGTTTLNILGLAYIVLRGYFNVTQK